MHLSHEDWIKTQEKYGKKKEEDEIIFLTKRISEHKTGQLYKKVFQIHETEGKRVLMRKTKCGHTKDTRLRKLIFTADSQNKALV